MRSGVLLVHFLSDRHRAFVIVTVTPARYAAGVSRVAFICSLNQRGEHFGQNFQLRFEIRPGVFGNQFFSFAKFQQRYALKDGSSCNPPEILPILNVPSAIALGNFKEIEREALRS